MEQGRRSWTVGELAQVMGLETVVQGDSSREITGGYCGDLLSWVMGRAKEGDAWITVMGNVNAVAVAVLADAACILLAEDSPLDDEAKERALSQEVPVLRSRKDTFSLAVELGRLLGR